MTNNVSDNDIMGALEFCYGDNECSNICYQYKLPEERNGVVKWCRQWLIRDALDLINRLKGELRKKRIELYRLLKELNRLKKCSEFVRCKECQHSVFLPWCNKYKCKEIIGNPVNSADFYCGYGKPKEMGGAE